jgi:hypothetical protein
MVQALEKCGAAGGGVVYVPRGYELLILTFSFKTIGFLFSVEAYIIFFYLKP